MTWEVKRLGEVCEKITQGPNPQLKGITRRGNNFILKTKDFYNDVVLYENCLQINDELIEKWKRFLLLEGDIILGLVGVGSIGKCNIFRKQRNKKYIFTRATGLIRTNKKEISPEYLHYFLTSPIGDYLIKGGIGGTTGQLVIKTSYFNSVEIPIPPLREQKQIVEILDNVFDKISKAKKTAEKNLKNAEEVFESYLEKIFGNPGEDWEEKKLGEVFDFKNGRSFKKAEWRENGIPIIRIQNLNNENKEFNYYQGDYDDNIEVNVGDLLFSWSGTVGSSFGPHIWNRDKGLLNQHIFKIYYKKEINKFFSYYFFKHITSEIEKRVTGAVGLVHIKKEKLNKFKIHLPSSIKQKQIVSKLDALSKQVKKLESIYNQKLTNLEELKKSILQKAFSGQLTGGKK